MDTGENRMPEAAPESDVALAINRLVTWTLSHRAAIFRYAYIPQLIVGLFLTVFGYYIGRDHFHLIREGVRTQGTIVGYKQEAFPDRGKHWDTGFMPIVKFQTGDRIVQFEDWMGSNAGVLNVRVVVLYDPANPAVAMIDRPVWNWIPWAPAFGVGVFLVFVGVKGWLRSSLRA